MSTTTARKSLSTRMDEAERLGRANAEAIILMAESVARIEAALLGGTRKAPVAAPAPARVAATVTATTRTRKGERARDGKGRYLPGTAVPVTAPTGKTRSATRKAQPVTQTAQLRALCKATRDDFVAAALAQGTGNFAHMGTSLIAQMCVSDPALVPAGFRIGERYTEKFSG